jgi:hypothetical protein
MMNVRITLTLDETIVRKLREVSPNNISAFVNANLRKCLFERKKSLGGALRGKVSTKDITEDWEHGN